jgi:hypothetical protein
MMLITISCFEVLDDIDGERFPSNLVWVAVGSVGMTTGEAKRKSVVCAMLELVFREQFILFLLGNFLVGVACVLSLWQHVEIAHEVLYE